ncbi:hypothetical protein FACS1894199_08670 [Bacteroidia bacterium]|nr:hypothetical protein FACS1894199_08670 [Bacteroidia bacterium]
MFSKQSRYIIETAGLIFILLCFFGQVRADDSTRFNLGVQLGTDVGGCVPYPFRYVPETFNMYPKINLSLGGKLTFPVKEQWSLGAEVTYKTLSTSADARVKNQRFEDDGQIQYFTGSAEMNMQFTMLEFPLYAKYAFPSDNYRLLFGAYGTYVLQSKFVTLAKKGFVGTEGPDIVSIPLEPEGMEMVFSDALGRWDAGLVLGYERKIMSRFDLGLRFMWGFKDIFKPENKYFDYSMIHIRGVVVLSYTLLRI